MADYATLQARILSETKRSSLTTDVQNQIKSAIKHLERRRWWFQQDVIQFTTVSGQDNYGASAHSDIPNIIDFESAIVTGSAGNTGWADHISKVAYRDIHAALEVESERIPYHYAYHEKQIWLASPGSGYVCKFAVQRKLAVLSADGDSNAWTDDLEEVTRAYAKYLLYRDIIRQSQRAAEQFGAYQEALEGALDENRKRIDETTVLLPELAALTTGGGRFNIYSGEYGGVGW